MKFNIVTSLLLLMLGSNLSMAADCGAPVTADAVAKLAANTTLGEVAAKFGAACPGEGPVSWYQSAAGKQIWFYWKKTATPGAASTPILMVAEVNARDFDEQKLIWPQALAGKDVATIMLGEFGPGK